MSGLCGWIGHNATVSEGRQLINRMVQAVVQFDHHESKTMLGANTALAVADHDYRTHVYQEGELLVGIWGQVKFKSEHLNSRVETEGVAKIIANNWCDQGKKIFSELVGEFCLCIVNGHTNEVILAIDRLGTRSLSYEVSGDALIFSSTSDAIIRHPLAKSDINVQSLYNYVYFHLVPSPDTIYTHQKRLLPGEYIVFKKGEIKKERYWEPSFIEDKARPFDELQDELRTLLRSSMRDAVNGQTAGAFLSGGTDSSTIAGVLGEVTGEPARTYSIGFEATGYDEMEYARIASKRFSTKHHEYYVTQDDVVAAIPQIAAVFDQPFGNASAIPAFYCAQMAKADGVNKLLGGDGGDELFGGNERYAKQYLFSFYDHIPELFRQKILEPLAPNIAKYINQKFIRRGCSYIEQASVPMPERMETYNLLVRYGFENVFTPEFLSTVDAQYPAQHNSELYHQIHADSLVNRMLAFDWKLTLADNDLPKVVKACELAQMDVVFPLISNELIDFSAQLEPQMKLKGTKLRYFFKEALRGFLPDEIISKQKHGFGLPFGVWLQTHKPLQEMAADSLSDLKRRKIIRDDFIEKLLSQHLHEHADYYGTMIWILMMLEYWFKKHHS